MTNSWMRLTIVSKFIAQQLGYKLYLQHAILFSYCIGFCFLLIETVLDGKSKNVPQDDEFGDEQHDHNICVASHLGLAYGDLIPGECKPT
jgi:hypothetical protein